MKSQTDMYQNAQVLMSGNDDQAVIDSLEELLKQYPDFSPAHVDLGMLYHKKGDDNSAGDHLQKAVANDSNNKELMRMLADFHYVELKDVSAAIKIYENILDVDPNDVDTLTIVGNLCLCEHQWEDAQHYYRRVQEIEPWRFEIQEYLDKLAAIIGGQEGNQPESDVMTWYQSSQERVEAGDFPGAIQYLEKITEKDPDHALAYNDLGVIHYEMGEKEKALAYYQLAVEKMPDNHIFLKNVADFYCFEQGNLETALPIYLRIMEEEPSDIEVLMTLGVINTNLDRPADAKVFFQRVVDIEPWNSEAYDQLEQLGAEDSIFS